jgi:uncharacterized membrane protein YecN with MAPEG domain
MENIIVALITGGLSLIGVVVTNMMSNRKIEVKMQIAQAVTDTKIEELTREVRKHNNFAQRMPIVENEIKHIDAEITKLNSYHQPTN